MTTYAIPSTYDAAADLHARHEVIGIRETAAGPCATCDAPTVLLDVIQHIDHRGYRYTMNFTGHGALFYVHTDGVTADHRVVPREQCEQCKAYAIERAMEAYGDRVDCRACGASKFYSIGD